MLIETSAAPVSKPRPSTTEPGARTYTPDPQRQVRQERWRSRGASRSSPTKGSTTTSPPPRRRDTRRPLSTAFAAEVKGSGPPRCEFSRPGVVPKHPALVAPILVAAEEGPAVRDLAAGENSSHPHPKHAHIGRGCCPTRSREWAHGAPNQAPPMDPHLPGRPCIDAPSSRQSQRRTQIARRGGGGRVAHVFHRGSPRRGRGQVCRSSCHPLVRIGGGARYPIEQRRGQLHLPTARRNDAVPQQ